MGLFQTPQALVPASLGGMTSLASGSIAASATGFDLTSISGDYYELWLYITNYSLSTSADIQLRVNANSSTNYSYNYLETGSGASAGVGSDNRWQLASSVNATQVGQSAFIRLPNYANTTGWKFASWQATKEDNKLWTGSGLHRVTNAINRLTFTTTAGTFDAGTYQLFGVK